VTPAGLCWVGLALVVALRLGPELANVRTISAEALATPLQAEICVVAASLLAGLHGPIRPLVHRQPAIFLNVRIVLAAILVAPQIGIGCRRWRIPSWTVAPIVVGIRTAKRQAVRLGDAGAALIAPAVHIRAIAQQAILPKKLLLTAAVAVDSRLNLLEPPWHTSSVAGYELGISVDQWRTEIVAEEALISTLTVPSSLPRPDLRTAFRFIRMLLLSEAICIAAVVHR